MPCFVPWRMSRTSGLSGAADKRQSDNYARQGDSAPSGGDFKLSGSRAAANAGAGPRGVRRGRIARPFHQRPWLGETVDCLDHPSTAGSGPAPERASSASPEAQLSECPVSTVEKIPLKCLDPRAETTTKRDLAHLWAIDPTEICRAKPRSWHVYGFGGLRRESPDWTHEEVTIRLPSGSSFGEDLQRLAGHVGHHDPGGQRWYFAA